MSKYLFSVITPFHNVDMDMFENAVSHMERQTIGFENVEWIIVCHNCQDEYTAAVRKRVESSPNVLVRELKNDIHTPSSPRNYGLQFATADYVGFLDGDDNYRNDAIEKILAHFNSSKAQMLVFRRGFSLQKSGMTAISETVAWNQTFDEIVVSKEDSVNNKTYNDFPFFITSRAYDRSFLEREGITFDESMTIAEDCYFNLEVMHRAERTCFCPQLIGYNYFVNGESMLNAAKSDEEILEMADCADRIIRRALDYGIYYNVIIKTLCFVLCRYAADPNVSPETKRGLKNKLEPYLFMTKPVPDGRFTEPFNTLLNTLPQQVFSRVDEVVPNMVLDGKEILAAILVENMDTDYGKRYQFEDLLTVKGYQSMVPLSDEKMYSPLVDLQISIGQKNIFCSSPAKYYLKNARGMSLPIVESQYKEFVQQFMNLLEGRQVFLWYADKGKYERYNDGVPANTVIRMCLSGYYDYWRYEKQEPVTELTSPECVYFSRSDSPEDVEYLHLLLAAANRKVDQIMCDFVSEFAILAEYIEENIQRLAEDIERGEPSLERALPASEMRIIRAYLSPDPSRARELRDLAREGADGFTMIMKLWPELEYVTCASTGMYSAAGRKVMEKIPGVHHSNGVVANIAGVFGIDVEGADEFELITGVNFYEFLENEDQDARALTCSEIGTGKDYQLVVTTPAGLYRYKTGLEVHISRIEDGKIFFSLGV